MSLRVVHKHTAASSSTSPASTGQHSFGHRVAQPYVHKPAKKVHACSELKRVDRARGAPGGGGQGLPARTKPEIVLVYNIKVAFGAS